MARHEAADGTPNKLNYHDKGPCPLFPAALPRYKSANSDCPLDKVALLVFTDICHSLRIFRSRSTRSVPNDQFSGTRCILHVSIKLGQFKRKYILNNCRNQLQQLIIRASNFYIKLTNRSELTEKKIVRSVRVKHNAQMFFILFQYVSTFLQFLSLLLLTKVLITCRCIILLFDYFYRLRDCAMCQNAFIYLRGLFAVS